MSLISMHGAWLSFSDSPLLDNAELHIEDNERVCLVGRNGAGKSTLMKILNREQGLDDGRIVYEQDLIVSRLQQDPPRHVRRKNSLQWTMALLVTSIMLYLPANILPIMITDLLGDKMPSTILAGVILLWGEGSYPVAGVIFIASIMVPTLKMIAIAWLCWDAKGHGKRDSERMHLIYEVVEFVGRWSMIDVFVIAVLSALVRMGGLMSIYPAMGASMFALVVIMTMFAAMTFDPRLSWDREPESSHEEE